MTISKMLVALFLISLCQLSHASASIGSGVVKNLTSKGGWLTFQVLDNNNVNVCAACPNDPAARGPGRCWVNENNKTHVALVLFAQARAKKIYGRVEALASNCTIVQLEVAD